MRLKKRPYLAYRLMVFQLLLPFPIFKFFVFEKCLTTYTHTAHLGASGKSVNGLKTEMTAEALTKFHYTPQLRW